MKIRRLTIKHFRGIENAELVFSDHNLLIGPNNVGKSTVLSALNLLFGRGGMVPDVNEYDFFNKEFLASVGDAPRIEVAAVLTDFDEGGVERRAFWDLLEGGPVRYWDPVNKRLCGADKPPAEGTEAVEMSFLARFAPELGEFEAVRVFPSPHEDPFEDAQNPVRRKHLEAVGFYYLPTARLWERALRFNSSTFRRLVSEMEACPGTDLVNLCSTLEDMESCSGEALEEVVKHLTATLGEFVELPSEPSARFSLTELTMDDVARNLVFFLSPHTGTRSLPISRHGSGVISLQALAMLMQFGKLRKEDGKSFIMAVEEPELHLYPYAQRQLVNRLRECCTQTICSTHSPFLTEAFSPDEIAVLHRKAEGGHIGTTPLLDRAPKKETKNLMQSLFFRRRREVTQALMGRLCLLVEGFTEAYLLPRLSEIDNSTGTFSLLGVSALDIDGSQMPGVAEMLVGIAPVVVCLIDGDDAGDRYRQKLGTLDSVTVLQLPESYECEKLVSHGLSPEASGKALKALKDVGYSRHTDGDELWQLLKGNKGVLPVYDEFVRVLQENSEVPPLCAALNAFLAHLATKGVPPEDPSGIEQEDDLVWRLTLSE